MLNSKAFEKEYLRRCTLEKHLMEATFVLPNHGGFDQEERTEMRLTLDRDHMEPPRPLPKNDRDFAADDLNR